MRLRPRGAFGVFDASIQFSIQFELGLFQLESRGSDAGDPRILVQIDDRFRDDSELLIRVPIGDSPRLAKV